jgi:hypothetical protein
VVNRLLLTAEEPSGTGGGRCVYRWGGVGADWWTQMRFGSLT